MDMDVQRREGMTRTEREALELAETTEKADSDGIFPRHKKCPFCVAAQADGEGHVKGNIRHHHLYCKQPKILRARETFLSMLEEALQDLMHELNSIKGQQWLEERLLKLKDVLKILELKSVEEMCTQCKPKTKPRRNNMTIVDEADLNENANSEVNI